MKNRTPFSTVLLFALAYLVVCSPPSEAATWQQTHRIQPSEGLLFQDFGKAVSLVDNVAVIGAPSTEGFSHTFVYSVETGEQLSELEPNDFPGGAFGFSVGTDRASIIVGSKPDIHGFFQRGSALVFDITTGEQIAELIPSGISGSDDYGYSVAISGNSAIVGAPANFSDEGSAYLFNVETKQLTAELKAPPSSFPNRGDFFGDSVAISDQFAIVGAPNFPFDGSAFLYDAQTGESLGQLVPESRTRFFGTSVAISNGIAIIGADRRQGGAAYLFDLETGEQLHELISNDIAADDFFGQSVAISGNLALVGAIGNDDQGSFSGSAYLFNVSTGEQLAKFLPDDGHAGAEFGRSVAIDGQTILIGAPATLTNNGAAYVFELVPEPSALLCLWIGIVTLLPINDRRCGC